MNLLAAILFALAVQNTGIDSQIAEISKSARGNLGVAAVVIETGRAYGFKAEQRYPMQSVYKFPVAMAVLRDVDAGKLKLDQLVDVRPTDFVSPGQRSPIRDKNPGGAKFTVQELLRWSVSESDGTAFDVLLKLVGGADVGTRYLRNLNVQAVDIVATEKEMGKNPRLQYRNSSTPTAMVQLLRAFWKGQGLSASSRGLLLDLMIHSGNDARIKGRLPAGTVVAHKTGTSGTVKGVTAATNDVGIVTLPDGKHVAIAVFLSDCRGADAARDEVIAKTARVIWDWARNGTR